MKKILLAVAVITAIGTQTALGAENAERLEKAAEKNELKADRQEHKAEIDAAENKTRGTKRHARKAALDEIKSEKEEQRVQTTKGETTAKP